MKTIQINDIIRVVELLKQVNNKKSALVSEVAKEMGVRKTDLMEYINLNSKRFILYNDTKGKYIHVAFPDVSDNPYNPEWLHKKQKKEAKTLYVLQWNYYGQLEDYYVKEDTKSYYDNSNLSYQEKKYLWRNTKEKMDAFIATGHFYEGTGSTGSFTGTSLPYCLRSEHMLALIDEGWTLDGALPDNVKQYQNDKRP